MHSTDHYKENEEFDLTLISSNTVKIEEKYDFYYHNEKYDVRILHDKEEESCVTAVFNPSGIRVETSHKIWTALDVMLYCDYIPDPTKGE